MSFRAPIADLRLALDDAGLERLHADGLAPEASPDTVAAILGEAARFAEEVIYPLDRSADRVGARFDSGTVTPPPGFDTAWQAFVAAGWSALALPPAHGGQGLPWLVQAACLELWNSGSVAFGLVPLLTAGAVEAIASHGSADLQQRYLPHLVSGAWTGTMNLTEPQAGSDLSLLRCRAARHADGSYRVTGAKIYITWGEHDLAGNIVHLVLARLDGAPAGTRGISLFLVPKILPDGGENALRCTGIERKLGLHGSPTCSMSYEGATGYLIGEEHRGLACMFTMMNAARLAVGVQGVAVAERATQRAEAFARARVQGRAPGEPDPGPIARHPDVQRMLLIMRARTLAARALCHEVAEALDRAAGGDAAAHDRAALMTPIAKAFATDAAVEVASLGIQVHGGAGFIEDTGAAQDLRDARILPIYEGTNGIQAIDLVTRKLALGNGAVVAARIDRMRRDARAARETSSAPLRRAADRLDRAVSALARTIDRLGAMSQADQLAGANACLDLFGIAAGGTALLRQARSPERIAVASAFASQIATRADGLAEAAASGADFAG